VSRFASYVPVKPGVLGVVYLIHFHTPLGHAGHYIGYCRKGGLDARLAAHLAGCGSRLLAVALERGITWELARTWDRADRYWERRLKNCGGAYPVCPVCSPDNMRALVVVNGPLRARKSSAPRTRST
jgi:hypothetical protein